MTATKTRAERETELRELLNSPGGKDAVYKLFVKALNLPPGTQPPVGLPRVATILSAEYPNG